MKKSWIDWSNTAYGTIMIPEDKTKTKEPRNIPLFKNLSGTLKKWCNTHDHDNVFSHLKDPENPQPFTSFKNFWNGARNRADLKDFRIHELRHTFTSWWAQKGGYVRSERASWTRFTPDGTAICAPK